MMKTFWTFIFIIATQILFAQDYPYTTILKVKINNDAILFLKQQMPRAIGAAPQFSFNFESGDVQKRNKKEISEIKTNQEYLDSLKRTLTFSYKDAFVNYNIAQGYLDLGNMMQYEEYMNRAYTNCTEAETMQKDSASYPILKAQLFAEFQRNNEAEKLYAQIKKKFPNEITPYAMLVILYLKIGQYQKANQECLAGMKRFPESEMFYFYTVLTQMYMALSNLSDTEIEELYTKTPTEELFNIKYAKFASEKYPKNTSLKLTYLLSRTYVVISKTLMTTGTITDLKYDSLPRTTKKEIKNIEKQFKHALKNSQMPNKYISYYSLGALSLLKNKKLESINYFNNALQERIKYPNKKTSNSGKVYDNLASAYLLNNDTVNTLRILKDKIEAQPEIYPNPNDYFLSLFLYLQTGNIEKATKLLSKAKQDLADNAMMKRGEIAIDFAENKFKVAQDSIQALMYKENIAQETYLMQGIILLSQNQPEKAAKAFNSAYLQDPQNKTLNKILEHFFEKK